MFKNTPPQKLIIFSIVLFFIASSAWLFYTSEKFANPAYNSDWWGIYFENPGGPELNFVIENHSVKNNFQWEVLSDNKKIQEGSAEVAIGQKKNISVENSGLSNKKIIIRVIDGTETKEIYRNY